MQLIRMRRHVVYRPLDFNVERLNIFFRYLRYIWDVSYEKSIAYWNNEYLDQSALLLIKIFAAHCYVLHLNIALGDNEAPVDLADVHTAWLICRPKTLFHIARLFIRTFYPKQTRCNNFFLSFQKYRLLTCFKFRAMKYRKKSTTNLSLLGDIVFTDRSN